MKRTPPYLNCATGGKGKNNDENDDDGSNALSTSTPSKIASGLPSLAALCVRSVFIATVTLYVMNQKHLLPLPMSKAVSQLLFWPTLPITLSKRIGKWTTVVDNAVVMGGAPIGWWGYPEKLARDFNVRGVINMCDEYRGPVSSYERLGLEQLWLPTVDHFEPSVEDLKSAVSFISKHESQGSRVYVHCKAGHGRSAAVVYSWLLYKEPLAHPLELNEKLSAMRNVRKSLWRQPNINSFRVWLNNGGTASDRKSDDDIHSRTRLESIKPRGKEIPTNLGLLGSETEYSGSEDSDD